MSSYVALYRKWRPRNFDDVVGQNHITTTLKNQITENRIAHAYLFCGTRGTGKTSTAKIFAKAVNCKGEVVPCSKCESCMLIESTNTMDIIEIDAASNNSVDDVRELRDKVKYPPSKAKYKVYIIDEVHMLSTGAFNALLKTLEEPPSHVIFILATTEPHKLPATIISRCQRFDFRRVGEEDMLQRLSYICKESGIDIEEEALRIIISNSDGAMRDSLSILDQCASVISHNITLSDINNILGIVNAKFVQQYSEAIINRDIILILDYIDELYCSGKDIGNFIRELMGHFRIRMINSLKANENTVELENIIEIINELSTLENQLRWSTQPRILVETHMIKLCNKQEFRDKSIIDRIDRLEQAIMGKTLIGNNEKQGTSAVEEKKANYETNNKKELDNNEERQGKDSIGFKDVGQNKEENSNSIQFNGLLWEKLLEELKNNTTHRAIFNFLEKAKPLYIKGETAFIGFDDPALTFNIAFLETGKNLQVVEEIISKLISKQVKIQYKMVIEEDNKSVNGDKELIEEIVKTYGKEKVEIID